LFPFFPPWRAFISRPFQGFSSLTIRAPAFGHLALLTSLSLARPYSRSFHTTTLLIQGWALAFGCLLLSAPITTTSSGRDIFVAKKKGEIISFSSFFFLQVLFRYFISFYANYQSNYIGFTLTLFLSGVHFVYRHHRGQGWNAKRQLQRLIKALHQHGNFDSRILETETVFLESPLATSSGSFALRRASCGTNILKKDCPSPFSARYVEALGRDLYKANQGHREALRCEYWNNGNKNRNC